MDSLPVIISTVALCISALTFFYTRHESRSEKKWLLYRLHEFKVDLELYLKHVRISTDVQNEKYGFAFNPSQHIWNELKLERRDLEILSVLKSKESFSLKHLRSSLEYFYLGLDEPIEDSENKYRFEIRDEAEYERIVKTIERNIVLVDGAIGLLSKYWNMIF